MRHRSIILNSLTIGFSVLCIILSLTGTSGTGSLAVITVLASVFLIGIPHGAIDHIMAAELFGLNKTLKDHLLFYASYLIIMLAVGLLWYLLPVGGMILFLAISVYHFGQADMEDFLVKQKGSRIWHITRGSLIIGLIVFADTTITYPIMTEAMNISPDIFTERMPDSQLSVIAISSGYVLIMGMGAYFGYFNSIWRLTADSILLILVLLITGPLIGFALYFALWHSAGHINEMRDFFKSRGKNLTVPGFYKKALPFTAVSIVGLGFLAGVNHAFGLDEQFLSLMFILISVLTLPHMVIVDRMYKEG
jgi:beta-carotene 15,15'-dioxygenase